MPTESVSCARTGRGGGTYVGLGTVGLVEALDVGGAQDLDAHVLRDAEPVAHRARRAEDLEAEARAPVLLREPVYAEVSQARHAGKR